MYDDVPVRLRVVLVVASLLQRGAQRGLATRPDGHTLAIHLGIHYSSVCTVLYCLYWGYFTAVSVQQLTSLGSPCRAAFGTRRCPARMSPAPIMTMTITMMVIMMMTLYESLTWVPMSPQSSYPIMLSSPDTHL